MKKSRKKRGIKNAKRILYSKKDMKKSLPYRLLKICLIILGLLVIAWIIAWIIEYDPQEKISEELNGELGTLKWDFDEYYVNLDVLDYNVSEDNETISINLNWTSGNQIINAIFIEFEMSDENCNHTILIRDGPGGVEHLLFPRQGNIIIDSFLFGINKTWNLYSSGTNCYPRNFENLTGISAYSQIHVNLTQIVSPIPNITLYDDDSLGNVVDLDDYFYSLVNISYWVVGDSEDKTGIEINGTTNFISFDPKLERYGTYEFNLTASEKIDSILQSGDVLNSSNNGNNMTFYVKFINTNRPIPNNAPDFRNSCEDFSININNTQIVLINMSYCFDDDDDDTLVYRYDNFTGNITTQNISVFRNGVILTLTAKSGYLGTSTFKIYANDSKEEVGNNIDVRVHNYTGYSTNTTNQTNQTAPTPTPSDTGTKIISSNPAAGTYNLGIGEGKNFSITPQNYTSIQWFLNDVLAASGVTQYGTGNLGNGSYIVRVEINGPTGLDSKTWTIIVGDEEISESVSVGKVIFWSIIAVTIIIILLIIWLFVAEKNKKSDDRISLGFGVSLNPGTSVGRPLKSEIYKSPR